MAEITERAAINLGNIIGSAILVAENLLDLDPHDGTRKTPWRNCGGRLGRCTRRPTPLPASWWPPALHNCRQLRYKRRTLTRKGVGNESDNSRFRCDKVAPIANEVLVATRKRLMVALQPRVVEGVRWENAGYHVTLRFLGEINSGRCPADLVGRAVHNEARTDPIPAVPRLPWGFLSCGGPGGGLGRRRR